jgi:hypothetical protein
MSNRVWHSSGCREMNVLMKWGSRLAPPALLCACRQHGGALGLALMAGRTIRTPIESSCPCSLMTERAREVMT